VLFGPYGDLDTNEFVHVQGTVDVSDVGQGMVGASQHAVNLADVGAVVAPDHDGVQRRRGPFKMNQQAAFVAF
jgi:hypothetical protein